MEMAEETSIPTSTEVAASHQLVASSSAAETENPDECKKEELPILSEEGTQVSSTTVGEEIVTTDVVPAKEHILRSEQDDAFRASVHEQYVPYNLIKNE